MLFTLTVNKDDSINLEEIIEQLEAYGYDVSPIMETLEKRGIEHVR